MTDFLTVKALRTFDAGTGLKTVDSPEFEIEAGHARELEAEGLVEIMPGGIEAMAQEHVPPKKRGKTDAVDQD